MSYYIFFHSCKLHLYWPPAHRFVPARDCPWNHLCNCVSSFWIFFQILNRMAPIEAINFGRNGVNTIKLKRFCSNIFESCISFSSGELNLAETYQFNLWNIDFLCANSLFNMVVCTRWDNVVSNKKQKYSHMWV